MRYNRVTAIREKINMASFSARARVQKASGLLFTVVGSSDSESEALAELNAKLDITSGVVISASATSAIDPLPTADGAGDGEDATLTLFLAGQPKRTVKIENMTLDALLAGSEGIVDITNGTVIAFATNYRDGQGNGGYVIVSGEYVNR